MAFLDPLFFSVFIGPKVYLAPCCLEVEIFFFFQFTFNFRTWTLLRAESSGLGLVALPETVGLGVWRNPRRPGLGP